MTAITTEGESWFEREGENMNAHMFTAVSIVWMDDEYGN